MPRKRHSTEQIIARLREVGFLNTPMQSKMSDFASSFVSLIPLRFRHSSTNGRKARRQRCPTIATSAHVRLEIVRLVEVNPVIATVPEPLIGVDENLGSQWSMSRGHEEGIYHNLVSTGQVALGGRLFAISSVAGDIELYRDGGRNSTFGVNPPNSNAPATFMDGELFLGGFFLSFVLQFDTYTGTGTFQSDLTWTAGTALGRGVEGDATFAGAIDLQVEETVVPEPTTRGGPRCQHGSGACREVACPRS